MMFAVERGWLNVQRRYLATMVLGNLVWEFAHMPLYTLWEKPAALARSSSLHFIALEEIS